MTKKCSGCKEEKSTSDFPRNKSREDGIHNYCKFCHNEQGRIHRRDHREHFNGRSRKWYWKNREKRIKVTRKYREMNPEKVRDSATKWRTKNPEKARAHWAVKYGIKSGRMKRQPCEVCGAEKVHAHHDSYARENRLDVRWLCRDHHAEHHRLQRESLLRDPVRAD